MPPLRSILFGPFKHSAMSSAQRLIHRLRRLVEAPPVRDRTVVKVIERSEQRLQPGFIIGVYRSGTTLLRYVLDSHSHIAVPPESNYLLPLAGFANDPWVHKGFSGMGVDQQGLLQHLREFAWTPLDDYAIAKGKRRWFDKTPSYTNILPFLDTLFGKQCRYIMLYRHGLDVANSMTKGHQEGVIYGPAKRYITDTGASPRLGYTRYWVDQCEKMLTFEAAHPQQCVRLRYEDYANAPQTWLPRVFDAIDEPWQPEVLEFHKQTHDFGLQDHKIGNTRGFSPSTANYRQWPQADIDACGEAAAPILEKLGYSV